MKKDLIFITPDEIRWYVLEDLPNEEWKDIKDFEGLYQVSNYGRVKTVPKYKVPNSVILKPYKKLDGVEIVSLYKNAKKKNKSIHRLVAQAFIPNPENKPEVNHINPITKDLCDNRVCNLEWVTSSENSQWTVKCGNLYNPCLGKFGREHHNAKPIVQLDMNGNYIKTWDCARDIYRQIGIDFRFVSRCCKHKCKSAHGFVFIFKEEYDEQMGMFET